MKIHYLNYLLVCLLLTIFSCKKDVLPEDPSGNVNTGTDTDSIPESFKSVDRGTTTFIVDLRNLRKLNTISSEVDFIFPQSEFINRDTTISVNQFLDIAQLLIPNNSLTEEESQIISNGTVQIKAIVRNSDGQTVGEKVFEFLSNGSRLKFEENDLLISHPIENDFSIEYGIPYFIQSKHLNGIWTADSGVTTTGSGVHIRNSELNNPSVNYQEVIFQEVPGSSDEFYIRFLHTEKLLSIFGGVDPITDELNYYLGISEYTDLQECYLKFKLIKSGKYFKIQETCSDRFLSTHNSYTESADFPPFVAFYPENYSNNNDQQLFRLVPSDLDYEIESSGFDLGQLSFSDNQISIAYQEEIRNCSGAELTEIIGNTKTEESTRELSSEESLELYSGSELSVGVEVGVEAGFSAFGASVTASLNVSTDYTYSTSSTTTSTKYYGNTETVIEETSRHREIKVPPYNQLSVFDGVSIVEAIPVDYVYRYQFKAKSVTNGNYLSSETLKTLLESSGFEGIIYNEGNNYLNISVRGKFYVDKLITTKTELIDLGECNE